MIVLIIIVSFFIILIVEKLSILFYPKISIEEVSTHINKNIKIYSTVVSAYKSKFGKNLIYLHLDADLPATKLIVFFYNEDLSDFIQIPAEYYIGKKICVTGAIKIFDGRIINNWSISQHNNLLKIKSEEISKYKDKFIIEVFKQNQIKINK